MQDLELGDQLLNRLNSNPSHASHHLLEVRQSDEQLIRPTTIGRKNYLFAKTEAGAEANAIWYTFIQTAKLNQLKVREYLEHLLSAFTWTESPVWEAYLPWDPEIQRKFGTQ